MASSPSASRDASPELLTPRAKLQALLRSVDSSDEENASPSATKRKFGYRAGLPRRASASPTQSHTSDDDSDVEIRPRGRLAARMQGAAPPSSATSGSTSKIPESSLPETARERVRRMLMQEEKENEAGKGMASNDTPNEAHGEAEDDDEELPVTRRRLKRKSSVQPELASTQEVTPVARSASPSLFVSPAKQSPSKASEHAEDSDNDLPTLKSDRFKALVQRKRQEREAREAAEEARKAERRAQQEKLASEMEELDSDDGNVSSITDDEGGRQLTQKARPSRKASKKAIEDMNRETQRMQRNMQLAHEAKTRKKITKNSLFERFNFRPAGENEPKTTSSSRPGTPTSDTDMKDADTAPSSPPTARKDVTEDMIQQTPVQAGNELPSVDELALQTPTLDKGKGKAVEVEPQEELTVKPKRQVRVKMPAFVNHISLDDSDDELQVTRTTRDKVKAVFDSVPLNKAKESHSLQALRALAQVKSPGQETKRRSDHSGMTPAELQYNLQQRARQQARLERERRVEQLKARGVVVQTAEEHEREKQEVENMLLAKAREEDRRLMQEERAAAKRKAREDGTADPLAWDDSEDEDYEERASKAGNDVDAEQSAVELSGSEEEGEAEEEEEQEEDETEEDEGGNPMFANEADEEAENAATETAVVLTDPLAIDEEELPSMNRRRGRNLKAVLSDDEDDVVEATPKPQKITHQSPAVPATDSPAAPGSVLRSAKKTFIPGLPVESGGPAGLGLTQIFAGTMDDSQSQMTPARGPTQSMMPDFDHFPDSNFSAKSERLIDESTQNEDTQTSTQGVKFNMTQSQMRRLDSLLQGPDTQISEMIEPSQDGGFQEHTPLHDRFVEPPTSTIQTVLLDRTASVTQAADSPLVQRGRLRRKLDVIHEAKDTESPSSATAFNALQDGAERQKKKEQQDDFDRKKSKAKEMVQEQADESEDEYAGLGGADGEDSDDESTASVQEMIDDEAGNDADKAKIAAFYAERERMEDEQGMEKLYKDVTTGMLRRKRGMDYDLSDSDDGGEARRKMKRRQHAKMRQALYADERIEKIAKDPGNQAFLRTIEDQGSEDEMDIFDGTEEVEEEHSTATPPRNDVESQTVPDSQPRKALGDGGDNPRAPAHLRRTKNGKKPADLGDVRKTLSNLLEDAEGSVIPATQAGSDSEEEEEEANEVRQASFRSDKENDAPNPRRGRVAVVDRISLKRNSSSNMSASRLAFATTDSTGSGIKVPVFLHRASSAAGSNMSSTSSSPSTTAAGGGFGEEAKIKKPQGARGRSGIHGFGSARGAGAVAESEAMAKVRESERRRMEKRARGAERRMGAVGGLLGKGSFA